LREEKEKRNQIKHTTAFQKDICQGTFRGQKGRMLKS